MELHVRHADGARRRRARCDVRPRRAASCAISRRRPHLSLPHAAGGATSTTARSSRRRTSAFSLNMLKEKGHPIIAQLLRDMRRRRSAGRRDASSCGSPKRGRDVPLFVAGLPIFSQGLLRSKPFEESTLDVAAWLAAPTRSAASSRALHRIRPRPGLVGRRPAGQPRPAQFRRASATNSTATAMWPSKASPARPICSARNSPRASGRRGYDFPAIKRRPGEARRAAGRNAVRRAGLVLQYAAATSSRIRGCARR